MRDYSQN